MLRRALFLATIAGALVAVLLGALTAWAVVADWYPVVPAEGFDPARKAAVVIESAAYGCVAGFAGMFAIALAFQAARRTLSR